MATTHRITEDIPDATLQHLIEERQDWHNSRLTWRGHRLGPADHARIITEPLIKESMTNDGWLAFMLDDPDYVIWSRHVPIAWHSTTRGVKRRHDASSWTWVLCKPRVWPSAATVKHYNRIARIVHAINQPKSEEGS